jgi:hypothetical protein
MNTVRVSSPQVLCEGAGQGEQSERTPFRIVASRPCEKYAGMFTHAARLAPNGAPWPPSADSAVGYPGPSVMPPRLSQLPWTKQACKGYTPNRPEIHGPRSRSVAGAQAQEVRLGHLGRQAEPLEPWRARRSARPWQLGDVANLRLEPGSCLDHACAGDVYLGCSRAAHDRPLRSSHPGVLQARLARVAPFRHHDSLAASPLPTGGEGSRSNWSAWLSLTASGSDHCGQIIAPPDSWMSWPPHSVPLTSEGEET